MDSDFEERLRAVELKLAMLIDRWDRKEILDVRNKTQLPSWFGVAVSILMFLGMLVGFYIQIWIARGP